MVTLAPAWRASTLMARRRKENSSPLRRYFGGKGADPFQRYAHDLPP